MSLRHNAGRRWLLASLLLVGIGSALYAATEHLRNRTEPPKRPVGRLLADTDGALEEWILFLGSFSPRMFLPTQADLVARSDPAIRFRIFHDNESVRRAFTHELERRGPRHAGRITWEPLETALPPWPRDYYIAGVDERGQPLYYLHHPEHYERKQRGSRDGTRGIRAALERLAGSGAIETRVRTDGGAVISDGERAFLSKSAAQSAVAHGDFAGQQAFLEYLRELWGLPVTVMDLDPREPNHHCDLYMMPAGKRHMVVGSPRLALELLEGLAPTEGAAFVRETRKLAAQADAGDPLHQLVRRDLLELLLTENARPARVRSFERVRAQLEALGYRCTEVPLLLLDPPRTGSSLVLSYTNVIQDERDGARTVYLPTYRLPRLDRVAKRVWRGLGFRVVSVDALGPALQGGALHCLSQATRSPATVVGNEVSAR